jgi:hypothetical protein
VRQVAARRVEPTAAIVDSQTVKTSGNVPESSQGIDAGKKIKGRKRHVLVGRVCRRLSPSAQRRRFPEPFLG